MRGLCMNRAAHEPGGICYQLRMARGLPPLNIPPDVAGWRQEYSGRFPVPGGMVPVTWAEIHAERAERQRERLEWIRRPARERVRAAQVWVFLIPDSFNFFTGWWMYLRTLGGDIASGGPKGNVSARSGLGKRIMELIPCGVLPMPENFDQWCEAFVKLHPKKKGKKDKRRAGIFNGWTDGDSFYLKRSDIDP